jgi:mRNA-degrading endonuclease RelE of RelBE toxin-antitoxin system
MNIVRTTPYSRRAAKLLSPSEAVTIEDKIASDPQAWPVIQGTGGVRKARGARGSSGKSGGVRVIYYVQVSADTLYFLSIYAKNEQENLTDEQKRKLREFVAALG